MIGDDDDSADDRHCHHSLSVGGHQWDRSVPAHQWDRWVAADQWDRWVPVVGQVGASSLVRQVGVSVRRHLYARKDSLKLICCAAFNQWSTAVHNHKSLFQFTIRKTTTNQHKDYKEKCKQQHISEKPYQHLELRQVQTMITYDVIRTATLISVKKQKFQKSSKYIR